MIDYNDRIFRSVSNSPNGEVSNETVFHYKQHGYLITANYSGGNISDGSLSVTEDENGNLNMRYHHFNNQGEFTTGVFFLKPEMIPNGQIKLHDKS